MARLGDRVVGAVGGPAHLELEQAGPAQFGASVVTAVIWRRVQSCLCGSLAAAGKAETAVIPCCPAIGHGNFATVQLAD
jgi:hypothetical protein